MDARELAVPGAVLVTSPQLCDSRGTFQESFRRTALAEILGYTPVVAQSNMSVSRRNTLRGLHGVLLPPGQAKFVTCVRGAVRDIVVDIRLGSPTFGVFDSTVLDAAGGDSVYVAEGLGHGFLALTDDACVNYLCSTEFVPGTPFEIDPLDPELDLPWGFTEPPIMSAKDAGAPTLAQARERGLLATYDECLTHYAGLKAA